MKYVITWNTHEKMRDPPGVPIARTTLPSFRTIVGVIEDSGRLKGSTALASAPTTPKRFGVPGFALKSSISSLSRKPAPVTTIPDPNGPLSV